MTWVSICLGSALSHVRRQAITWTNADLFSFVPLGSGFSEIQIKIQSFSLLKMHLKMLSAKCLPFCPGRDEIIQRKHSDSIYIYIYFIFQHLVHSKTLQYTWIKQSFAKTNLVYTLKQKKHWHYHYCMTISMQQKYKIIGNNDKKYRIRNTKKKDLWLMRKNIQMQIMNIKKKKSKNMCKSVSFFLLVQHFIYLSFMISSRKEDIA